MRIKPIFSGMICLLLVLGAFEPEAHGKRKKRGRNADAAEETTPSPENDGDAAEEEPDAESATADDSEPEGDAPKSISEKLTEGESDGGMRRSNRMEFDERLVKGQAAKSGAVYLFKRVPRHLPGLVPMRRSYRRRIVQPVLGIRTMKPARYSFEVEKALKLKKQQAEIAIGAPKPVVEAPVQEPEVESSPEKADSTPKNDTDAEENGKSRDKKKRKKKKKRK